MSEDSRAMIPAPFWRQIEEFIRLRQTGQIALNFFDGQVLTADVKVHIKAASHKTVDNARDISVP